MPGFVSKSIITSNGNRASSLSVPSYSLIFTQRDRPRPQDTIAGSFRFRLNRARNMVARGKGHEVTILLRCFSDLRNEPASSHVSPGKCTMIYIANIQRVSIFLPFVRATFNSISMCRHVLVENVQNKWKYNIEGIIARYIYILLERNPREGNTGVWLVRGREKASILTGNL